MTSVNQSSAGGQIIVDIKARRNDATERTNKRMNERVRHHGRDIGVYLRAVGATAGRYGAENDAGVEKGGGGGGGGGGDGAVQGRWSTTLLARRRPPGRTPLKKHSN
ncbi:hypothetical protein ALC56_05800 [Trachymyrmex septentrionalis]|uniref:Uncharacterized protein n=1 Tax=Trachymyrmex septentrionalis TaxID=34720 RepID=A0A151JXF9_9HYME|nr:hypothetical protein ALC56_05800 [Trachymyrmex septentrionalis]